MDGYTRKGEGRHPRSWEGKGRSQGVLKGNLDQRGALGGEGGREMAKRMSI